MTNRTEPHETLDVLTLKEASAMTPTKLQALKDKLRDVLAENARLQATLVRRNEEVTRIAALEAALNKIAYEPFGPSDATCAAVLNDITECARAALHPAPQPDAPEPPQPEPAWKKSRAYQIMYGGAE